MVEKNRPTAAFCAKVASFSTRVKMSSPRASRVANKAIFDGIYTTKSDVWSFGVLIWEIITLGYQPYLGLENNQVIEYIKNGFRLKISNKCPIEL